MGLAMRLGMLFGTKQSCEANTPTWAQWGQDDAIGNAVATCEVVERDLGILGQLDCMGENMQW